MPRVLSAVKAVIVNDDKFLVIKFVENNFEIWDIPGGRIKYKENPYETLIREVKEETKILR